MKEKICDIIIFCVIMMTIINFYLQNRINKENFNDVDEEKDTLLEEDVDIVQIDEPSEKIVDDWRIRLVNYKNSLPNDFEIELSNIDDTRKFDKRAIENLLAMMKDSKKDGIKDMWVQSAYRSIEYQQRLFDKKINTYISQGKTRPEAEKLALQLVNKPGTSEHNLGLAVDFNNVNYNFEKTNAFNWLQENAEKYGFILRYRRDKKEITKVNYEPWHWRYVGIEHAKKINELNLCLEEYVEKQLYK